MSTGVGKGLPGSELWLKQLCKERTAGRQPFGNTAADYLLIGNAAGQEIGRKSAFPDNTTDLSEDTRVGLRILLECRQLRTGAFYLLAMGNQPAIPASTPLGEHRTCIRERLDLGGQSNDFTDETHRARMLLVLGDLPELAGVSFLAERDPQRRDDCAETRNSRSPISGIPPVNRQWAEHHFPSSRKSFHESPRLSGNSPSTGAMS